MPYGYYPPYGAPYGGYPGYYGGSGVWFALFIILLVIVLIFGGWWYFYGQIEGKKVYPEHSDKPFSCPLNIDFIRALASEIFLEIRLKKQKFQKNNIIII